MTSPYQDTNSPNLVQPQDVDRYLQVQHRIAFTSTGSLFNSVTAELAAAALTAGENGQPVPNQFPGLNREGWHRDLIRGVCPINRINGDVPTFNGREISGYLVGVPSNWSFRTVVWNGSAYANQALEAGDYETWIAYNHSFASLPNDALVRLSMRRVSQDPRVAIQPTVDFVTVATLNTVPDLSATPRAGSHVKMYKNGMVYYSNDPAPIFSVAGQVVTYNSANAGVDLFPGDRLNLEFVT